VFEYRLFQPCDTDARTLPDALPISSILKSGPAASSRSNSRRSLFDKNTAVRCLQLDVGVGRGRGFAKLKAASLYGTAIHVQRQRSEEQTSELQSLLYIICSLLL